MAKINKIGLLVLSLLVTFSAQGLNREIPADVITDVKPVLSQDQYQTRDSFIGKWLSVQPTESGGTRNAVIERLGDSRYTITFKFFDSLGKLESEHKEFGLWGVSGGVYFTIYIGFIENNQMFKANPNDAHNYDTYKILSVTDNKLVYQSLSTGNKFTYKRQQ